MFDPWQGKKPHLFGLPCLLLLFPLFLLAACLNTSPLDGDPATLTISDQNSGESWYSLSFTDPNAPDADSYRGGPDEALAEAIDRARLSVDVAAYEFGLPSLRQALINAHRRGVEVRVVTDSSSMDYEELQDLIDAGIPVLGDRRESLMHDKFVVIDRQEVWTGSMNLTSSDTYHNRNNLLRLESSQAAENFTTEFEEMFVDDLFGQDTRRKTPYPEFTVEGTWIEIFFSPDDGTARHLVELLSSAQESIDFLAFSFTSDDLADAILERAAAGVRVRGVMDAGQAESNTGSEFDTFRQAGLDVRLDQNHGKMHHKVLIVDGKIVVTGSYNFTSSAERRNDENTVILYQEAIARHFMEEFQRIYQEAGR